MQLNISKNPVQIGLEFCSRQELLDNLFQFSKIYEDRPIKDNSGGMKAPQAFYAWYVAKKLKPSHIIESGVWYGQGTWFFEQACPDAKIISIEPNLKNIRYKSEKVQYITTDFNNINWSELIDATDKAFCFFDDHQNAISRLPIMKKYGFKHFMFEDNYPIGRGDCVSLKSSLEKNESDSLIIREFISIYQEMPPPIKLEKTRWNDSWQNYPTHEALILDYNNKDLSCFFDGAENYTWICYGSMK